MKYINKNKSNFILINNKYDDVKCVYASDSFNQFLVILENDDFIVLDNSLLLIAKSNLHTFSEDIVLNPLLDDETITEIFKIVLDKDSELALNMIKSFSSVREVHQSIPKIDSDYIFPTISDSVMLHKIFNFILATSENVEDIRWYELIEDTEEDDLLDTSFGSNEFSIIQDSKEQTKLDEMLDDKVMNFFDKVDLSTYRYNKRVRVSHIVYADSEIKLIKILVDTFLQEKETNPNLDFFDYLSTLTFNGITKHNTEFLVNTLKPIIFRYEFYRKRIIENLLTTIYSTPYTYNILVRRVCAGLANWNKDITFTRETSLNKKNIKYNIKPLLPILELISGLDDMITDKDSRGWSDSMIKMYKEPSLYFKNIITFINWRDKDVR